MNKANRSYIKLVLTVLVLAILIGGFVTLMGVVNNCASSCSTQEVITVDGTYTEVSEEAFDDFIDKVEDAKYGLKLNLNKGYRYNSTINSVDSYGITYTVNEARDIKGSYMHATVSQVSTFNGEIQTVVGNVWDDGNTRYFDYVSTNAEGVETTNKEKTSEEYNSIEINTNIELLVESLEATPGTIKYFLDEEGRRAKIEFVGENGMEMTAMYAYSSKYELGAASLSRKTVTVSGKETTTAAFYQDDTVDIVFPDFTGYKLVKKQAN